MTLNGRLTIRSPRMRSINIDIDEKFCDLYNLNYNSMRVCAFLVWEYAHM